MRCFVINLKSEVKRLDNMASQLDEMGIVFERFEAISGASLNEEEKAKVYDSNFVLKKYWKPFTDGELWCALSHFAIYKKIVAENIDICLILEDDIDFQSASFLEIYRSIKQPVKWHYLSLNYDIFDIKFLTKFYINLSKNFSFKNIFYLLLIYMYIPIEYIEQRLWKYFHPFAIPQLRPLHLAWAYFLTLEWAKILLSCNEKIQHPADYIQNQARIKKWLKAYFVVPQIVFQNHENFTSSTR